MSKSVFMPALLHLVIRSFISGMDHYECVAPDVDIILQIESRFWATSLASFRERFSDFQVLLDSLHLRSTEASRTPGGLLQFSKEKLLRSAWRLIRLSFTECSCGRTFRDTVPEQ